jgi:hypothetical protein
MMMFLSMSKMDYVIFLLVVLRVNLLIEPLNNKVHKQFTNSKVLKQVNMPQLLSKPLLLSILLRFLFPLIIQHKVFELKHLLASILATLHHGRDLV